MTLDEGCGIMYPHSEESMSEYLIKELPSGQVKIVEVIPYKEQYWNALLKYVEENYGSSFEN